MLKTQPWSLTGSGICLSLISEAMRNAYSAAKIIFPQSVPDLVGTNYPVLYGWLFNGKSGVDSDEQMIVINLDASAHCIDIKAIIPKSELNYQQISPGLVSISQQGISSNVYDPRVYITGLGANELGTALLYNDGHLYGTSDKETQVPPLNSLTSIVDTMDTISLAPYSITRIYQVHNDIALTANHDSSFTSGSTNVDGSTIQNGATQLSASGASYYLWQPVNNLLSGEGTEIYAPKFITLNDTIYAEGSFVIIDPSLTSTYYVRGYDANNNKIGSTKSISINITNINSSLNLSFPSNQLLNSSCNGLQLTPSGNATDYWWAPTEGLFNASKGGASIIHTTPASPSVFARPLTKTIYSLLALDNTTGFYALRYDTIAPSNSINILLYENPDINKTGKELCNSNSSIYFNAVLPNGYNSVIWTQLSTKNGATNFSSLNPTASMPLDTFGGSTIIHATSQDTNGCLIYGTYNLNIDPSLSIIAYKNEMCLGEQLSLSASGSPSGYFQWSAEGPGQYNITCVTCNPTVFNPLIPGQYIVTATETSTDTSCPSNTNNASVDINVLSNKIPNTTISPTNISVLQGCNCITLKASSLNNSQNVYWSWYPVNNFQNGSNYNSNQITVCPASTTIYSVNEITTDSLTNPYGCCGNAQVVVTVIPPTISCNCGSANGNCYLDNGSISVDTVTGEETFQWYYSNGSYTVPLNIYNSVYAINLNVPGLTDNAGDYWAVETLNDCSATSNIIHVQQGSCPATATMTVYPNPTSDQLTIITNAPAINMQIINILGQVIQKYEWFPGQSQQIIDVSKLAAGMYIVELQTNNGKVVSKFIRD